MRFAIGLLAVSATLLAAASAMPDEPAKPASPAVTPGAAGQTGATPANAESPYVFEHHYTVHCRLIDKAHDNNWVLPTLTVTDGKKESVSKISQSPFVTGVSRWTDPKTKKLLGRNPLITVIDEGVKVDLVVAGWPPDGATVDATVELTTIGDVGIKQAIPETATSELFTMQAPSVEIAKKRVIDFVKFGEPFVVPLSEKRADGTRARVEIVVDELKDK